MCDKPSIDGLTHPKCVTKLGLDGIFSVFQNRGVIQKAIKLLKYRFVTDIGQELIDLIPTITYQSLKFLPDKTYLYPIPLHEDRLRWRGFNQAEKLGKLVSKKITTLVIDGLLVRKTKRMPQADIKHRNDRIKNAQGLFSLINNLQLATCNSILLFDDVWTTGATMKEAAKVLKRNGVERVWGLSIAR